MSTVYLFQTDMAQNNDIFFDSLFPSASVFYKGITFKVGLWIPDGLRVDVQESRCLLTLIELEDTKSNALISSRKYLPESSDLILQALSEYIERVISQCQSTGDSRQAGFKRLKELLEQGVPFIVRTACALRSSIEIIEELSLIDQPQIVELTENQQNESHDEAIEATAQNFQGILRLDGESVKALGRCVLILDSIIRHNDHSNARCHSWRDKAPLKRILKDDVDGNPILKQLILLKPGTIGMRIDFEALLSELIVIWENAPEKLAFEDVRRLIREYYPVASRIRGHAQMGKVFEEARKYIKRE